MGAQLKRLLLVGCEPATLGPEEGQMGLSDRVAAAVDDAAERTLALVAAIRGGDWPGDGQARTAKEAFDDGCPGS